MKTEQVRAPDVIVDARGHRCPTPTLRLRRALAQSSEGDMVVLLADDPMARIDVPHFVIQAGHTMIDCRHEGGALRFSVMKGASAVGAARDGCRA